MTNILVSFKKHSNYYKLTQITFALVLIFTFQTTPANAVTVSNGEVTISWKPVKKPRVGKCVYQFFTVSSNIQIDSASLAIGGKDASYRKVGLPDDVSFFPSVAYYTNEINPGFVKQERMLICNYMTKTTLPPYVVDFFYYRTINDLLSRSSITVQKKFKFKK